MVSDKPIQETSWSTQRTKHEWRGHHDSAGEAQGDSFYIGERTPGMDGVTRKYRLVFEMSKAMRGLVEPFYGDQPAARHALETSALYSADTVNIEQIRDGLGVMRYQDPSQMDDIRTYERDHIAPSVGRHLPVLDSLALKAKWRDSTDGARRLERLRIHFWHEIPSRSIQEHLATLHEFRKVGKIRSIETVLSIPAEHLATRAILDTALRDLAKQLGVNEERLNTPPILYTRRVPDPEVYASVSRDKLVERT